MQLESLLILFTRYWGMAVMAPFIQYDKVGNCLEIVCHELKYFILKNIDSWILELNVSPFKMRIHDGKQFYKSLEFAYVPQFQTQWIWLKRLCKTDWKAMRCIHYCYFEFWIYHFKHSIRILYINIWTGGTKKSSVS